MLVLVGPSASGKTQAANLLIKKDGMKKMVTYTTRSMRPLEKEGVDYHFLTKEEFLKKIEENFFLEYVIYNGNYYGTSYDSISDDKVVILEPNGLKVYLEKIRDQIKVVYLESDPEIIKVRMRFRGESEADIEKRIALDATVFTKEVAALADKVIDSNYIDLATLAKEIYDFYHEK